jgi:hypothetical protein
MVRWYDRFSNITDMLHITGQMPVAVRLYIGKNLLESVQKYQSQTKNRRQDNFKSLGSKVVLKLYKSKSKLRWYDEIPEIHIALNMMLIALPDYVLHQINYRCARLIEYISELDPNPSTLPVDVKTYLDAKPFIEIREKSGYINWQGQDIYE